MEEHKTKHKHAAPSVQNLRAKQKETTIEIRKEKKDRKFNAKRVRLEESEGKDGLVSLQETEAACRQLAQKGLNTMDCLLTLRRAFVQGPEFIDVIFKVDNSLQSLVGILTGNNIELQEQVAWCMTNMATGNPQQVMALAKAAAPYCITYISGSSPVMQDQCAWVLANIAGENEECRRLLQSMGCLPPLINLLESSTLACVKSAAFAISNLIQVYDVLYEAVRKGLLTVLLPVLQRRDLTKDVLSELGWVVTYLTSSHDKVIPMVSMGFLHVAVDIMVHFTMTNQLQKGELITPFLRSLGNICAGPGNHILLACENPHLMSALLRLLQCHLPHVVKETMWVLSSMVCNYSVAQSVLFGPMLKVMLSLMDKGPAMQVETLQILCNMSILEETGSREIVSRGILAKVVSLLKSVDLEVLDLALHFCASHLRSCDDARFVFEECGGIKCLEDLEYHPTFGIHCNARELLNELCDEEEGYPSVGEDKAYWIEEENAFGVGGKKTFWVDEEKAFCVDEEQAFCVDEEQAFCVDEKKASCVDEKKAFGVGEDGDFCVGGDGDMCVGEDGDMCVGEEGDLCVGEEEVGCNS